jgi:ribosome-binding protein aMBF1 (putative translation factor)
MAIEYIEKNGRRTFAIVPMQLWRRAMAALGDEAAPPRSRSGRRERAAPVPEAVARRARDTGSAVLAWREHRGLSQAQLAGAAGISKAYLSQIENGARRGSVRALSALARALDVPLDALAG